VAAHSWLVVSLLQQMEGDVILVVFSMPTSPIANIERFLVQTWPGLGSSGSGQCSYVPVHRERLLSVLCEDPDNIVSWKNLLLFSFCYFAVPGQRGGKRHSSTLALKMNKRCAW